MSEIIVGTCSICGGPVVRHDIFLAMHVPPTRCKACGAVAARAYGPVIEMVPEHAPPVVKGSNPYDLEGVHAAAKKGKKRS